MAWKKKLKFDIIGNTSPPGNVSAYNCSITGAGQWKKANRNENISEDREGWGATDVKVFVPSAGTKLCAPEPPFHTSDGAPRRNSTGSKLGTSSPRKAAKKAVKKAAAKKVVKKVAVRKAVKKAVKKTAVKKAVRKN